MRIHQILTEMAKISNTLPNVLYRYMSEEELEEIINAHWSNFIDWDEEIEDTDPQTYQNIIRKNGSHEGQYFKSLYINPNLRGDEKKSFSGKGYEFLVAFDTNALKEFGTITPYDACVGVNEKEARLWINKPLLSFFDPEETIKCVYYKKINLGLAKTLNEMEIKGAKLKGRI